VAGQGLARDPSGSGLEVTEQQAPRKGSWDLEFFGPARWPVALGALERGFPKTPVSWWQRGFERLQQVAPNDDPTQPIGVLMHGAQGIAGIALFFTSRRSAGPWRINASSWSVLPAARGRALWMARHSLCEPGAIYTALTPIDAATRLLQQVGFQAISDERVRVATARLAWRGSSGITVHGAAATLAALKGEPIVPALKDHQRLGCQVLALEGAQGFWPLVLRPRRRLGGLCASEVVYTGSTTALLQGLVPLSRHLVGRGHLLLDLELPQTLADTLPADLPLRRQPRLRLARGAYDVQGIDHLYSELVYLQHG
jgi:hypothetical protein